MIYQNNWDIGYNEGPYIRFLSTDKSQPPQSLVRFDYINRTGDFASANIDDTVMKIKAEDLVNVPPRQRYHWRQYEIQL
jgi:hypothetical protein